jgi:hypothetical protein
MDTKTFRMETLQAMEQYLQDEIRTRQSLKKRYSYIKNSVTVLNYTLLVVSLVVGATGVFVGPGIILSAVTSATSIGSIICPVVTKKMQNKAEKHSAIQTVAEEILNTVYTHISKALNDNFISEDEFKQIQDDIETYREAKKEIQLKYAAQKKSGLMETLTKHFENQSLQKVGDHSYID